MKEVQIVLLYLSSITSEGHAKLQQKLHKMKTGELASECRVAAHLLKPAMVADFRKRQEMQKSAAASVSPFCHPDGVIIKNARRTWKF